MAFIDDMKKRLLEEKAMLEERLSETSSKNPDNPADWQAKFPDINPQRSSLDELADEAEKFELRQSLEGDLERRLRDVNEAIDRFEAGTYGKCEARGEDIIKERLMANPAARTCIEHSQ